MKILSFDQAARVTGWSYWENEKPIEWGIVEPAPKNSKGGVRLHSLHEKFKKLILEYKPDIILLEDPVGGEEDNHKGAESNWKTMQVLCQVQGILLEVIEAESPRATVGIVSPSSWQYSTGIHRRDREGRKAGAKAFVEKTYGLRDVPQDVYDSICIAYHYIEISRPERSAF